MKNHALLISIPALLLTGALLSGDSLTVELTGLSVSDGTDYVLPYELTINNGIPFDAICYGLLDQITKNQTWQANDYDLSNAATSGEFAPSLTGYETVAYLSSYWYTGSVTTDEQIDLQHAIWNVFTPGTYTIPDTDTLVTGAVANESTAINDFDYSSYSFLEAIADPTTEYQAQPFVLYTPGNQGNSGSSTTPEPGTWLLLVIGCMLIGISKTRFARLAEARSGRA